MKLQTIIVFIVLLSVIRTGYAQDFDPCMADFTVTKAGLAEGKPNWKRVGERMRACDAFVVVSDSAYLFRKAFNNTLQANYDSLVVELKRGQAWRDSLVVEQSSFITLQTNVINRYDSLLVQSNKLVLDANANTTRALRRIKLLQWASVGSLAIGIGGVLAVAAIVK